MKILMFLLALATFWSLYTFLFAYDLHLKQWAPGKGGEIWKTPESKEYRIFFSCGVIITTTLYLLGMSASNSGRKAVFLGGLVGNLAVLVMTLKWVKVEYGMSPVQTYVVHGVLILLHLVGFFLTPKSAKGQKRASVARYVMLAVLSLILASAYYNYITSNFQQFLEMSGMHIPKNYMDLHPWFNAVQTIFNGCNTIALVCLLVCDEHEFLNQVLNLYIAIELFICLVYFAIQDQMKANLNPAFFFGFALFFTLLRGLNEVTGSTPKSKRN